MKRYSILIFVLLFCVDIKAQKPICYEPYYTDTVKFIIPKGYRIISTAQIIERAYSQPHPQKVYDILDCGYDGPGTMSVSPLSKLKQFKDLIRRGDMYGKWSYADGGNGRLKIALAEIVPVNISKEEAERMKAELAKIYGTDKHGNVYADWFSGDVPILYAAQERIFGLCSTMEHVYKFENGFLNENSRDVKYNNYTGTFEKCVSIYPNIMRTRRTHPKWYKDGYNLNCLGQWLNDRFRPPIDTLGGMLWLLTTDGKGQSHLTDLTPGAIAIRQKQLSQEVVKLVAQLPRMSFGFLITEDRRLYSGRFIQASYSKNDGWRLVETLTPRL